MSATATMRTRDLAAYAGVTYRQLDYWLRTGILGTDVATPGAGNYRRLDADLVPIVEALGRVSAGLGVPASGDVFARVVSAWRDVGSPTTGRVVVTLADGVRLVVEVGT